MLANDSSYRSFENLPEHLEPLFNPLEITSQDIDNQIKSITYSPDDLTATIVFCVVTLRNGYSVSGSSHHYNVGELVGLEGKKREALLDAKNKIRPLLEYAIRGHALVDKLHSFSQALTALKQGKKISRQGWNGKGMFVYMVPAAHYPAQTGIAKDHFGSEAMVPYNPYMAIKNVDNTVSTWVPSSSDCFAEDWIIE